MARSRVRLLKRGATSLKLENKMSAARLFHIADKVVMTVITAALIVAVPVSAIAFVVQTL